MSEKEKELSVAFSPADAVEATKDFVGYISDAEYGTSPLGMVGKAEFGARTQLAIQIHTDAYEKEQFEWFAPSKVIQTKWMYFIEALAKCGALKETDSSGKTNEEKIKTFAKSLIGMNFRWLERVNLKGVAREIDRLLLPEEYLGRVKVEKPTEIKTQEVKL